MGDDFSSILIRKGLARALLDGCMPQSIGVAYICNSLKFGFVFFSRIMIHRLVLWRLPNCAAMLLRIFWTNLDNVGKHVGLVLVLLFPRTLYFYFPFYWLVVISLNRVLIRDPIPHLIKLFLFKFEVALLESKHLRICFYHCFFCTYFISSFLLLKKVDKGQGLKCKCVLAVFPCKTNSGTIYFIAIKTAIGS